MRRTDPAALLALAALSAVVLVWSTPLLWMAVASFRPQNFGGLDMAALWPDFVPTLANFAEALDSADFPLLYLNTVIVCAGTLGVQLATVTLAGYAFARLRFPGKELAFYAFLLQLMLVPPILIVPNLVTVVRLGLYDSLLGVMAPYFASAFGVFLMRQTFRTIPKDFEEAAIVDGATRVLADPRVRSVLIEFNLRDALHLQTIDRMTSAGFTKDDATHQKVQQKTTGGNAFIGNIIFNR